jgi:hypothetical protein
MPTVSHFSECNNPHTCNYLSPLPDSPAMEMQASEDVRRAQLAAQAEQLADEEQLNHYMAQHCQSCGLESNGVILAGSHVALCDACLAKTVLATVGQDALAAVMPKRFKCRVGTMTNSKNENLLYVESPKTLDRCVIWPCSFDKMPAGIKDRITTSKSGWELFTTDELKALRNLQWQQIAAARNNHFTFARRTA